MDTRESDRGQTTIDFALGASIVLLGVAFVIVMAPNLFTPFAEGQSADPLTADRLADHLAESEFSDDESIEAFFYVEEGTEDNLAGELEASQFRDVNVELEDQSTGDRTEVEHPEEEEESIEAIRGESLPEESGQVTQSQRVVVYDGEARWLYVRVW